MATSTADGRMADASSSAAKINASASSINKPSFATRISESARKADEEAAHQRRAQPKAWSSVVTQNTPHAAPSTHLNGNVAKVNGWKDSRSVPDRQAWVYGNAVGLECKLTTKTGQSYEGILVAAQKSQGDHKLILKMVREKSDRNMEHGATGVNTPTGSLCGHGPDHKMIFRGSSIQAFEVPQAAVTTRMNAANGGFRTDTDISGHSTLRERNLQRWEAGPLDSNVDLSLDSNTGGWDQFKANEEQFGLKSDYDENLYTTQIDRSNPLYLIRARDAERIARDIEGQESTNAHIREERGLIDEDADEEEKYSGVRREFAAMHSTQPNRYVPPSRRNQTQNTTLPSTANQKDSHVDPAIISSQIARPAENETQQNNPVPTKTEDTAANTAGVPPATMPSAAGATVAKELRPARQSAKVSGSAVASNNIEQKVLDSFQQFSATEKIKIQDQKRTRASADKALRFNELVKFSQNFKLLTPVPKDLVSILTKDEKKQKEIIQKAQNNAQITQPTKIATLTEPQKAPRPLAPARWEADAAAAAAAAASTAHQTERGRQPSAAQVAQPSGRSQQPQVAPSSLSAKLSDHHRNHKLGTQGTAPNALSIHERRESRGSAQMSGLNSPQKPPNPRASFAASGAKLNVKAMEFKPTAPPFKPSSTSTTAVASSPRSGPTTRTISPAIAPIKFFSDTTTFAVQKDRPTPASEAKKKYGDSSVNATSGENGAKASAPPLPPPSQGGFQFPYRTAPTWVLIEDTDLAVDYKTVFNERRHRRFNGPQSHMSQGVAVPPHYNMMPQQIHGGGNGGPHMQAPHHNNQQIHHGHYGHPGPYEDHHTRPSPSNSSHYHSQSPRMQQPNVVYQPPMPGHAQMGYSQHMQYPTAMGGRQFSNGPNMGPMQGSHMPPMMIPSHSTGGFMPQQMGVPYNAQTPIYASPVPTPAMYGSPSQQSSGYPSPGRAAPMMVHQGSQQGQQPVFIPTNQYGQPMYAQQPAGHMMRPAYGSPQSSFSHHPYSQQQHGYPQQVHRTSSQGYGQPHHTPQPQQAVPHQAGPHTVQPSEIGDEVK